MQLYGWIDLKLLAVGVVLLGGCGGGGGMTPPPPPPNPTPGLASLSPSGTYAGTGGFPLTVNGSGFTSSSTVRWNSSGRATTFVSSGRLMAQIPSSDLSAPGMANVTVVNSPGGPPSNALTFLMTPGPVPGTGVIQLITIATDGSPGNGNSFTPPAISADGRFVAFQSDATNLVSGPSSGFSDIYVRDTCLGATTPCTPTTVRASVATGGTLANGNSRTPSISADGRFVAFDSSASNLVPGDTNGQIGPLTGLADVFVRDTCIGAPVGCTPTTTRVSLASDGSEANGDSRNAAISADGRFLTFNSNATNLVVADTNGALDVFVRDTCIGAAAGCIPSTARVSVANDGSQGDSDSFIQGIGGVGPLVAFGSFASNLVVGDTNAFQDIFVRNSCLGVTPGCTSATVRASVATDGTQSNADNGTPAISSSGRFVGFATLGTNLISGDTNGRFDVFIRDTCVGAPAGCVPSTSRVSVAFDGSEANQGSGTPSLSADGRLVAFESLATNLTPGGSSAPKHVFVRDTCAGAQSGCIGTTILLSITPDRFQGDGISDFPILSADGRFLVFRSTSTNLLPGVSSGNLQIFLARTGF